MFDRFTPAAKKALERMMQETLDLGHTSLGVGHLLVAITAVAKPPIATAIAEAGVAFEPLERALAARSAQGHISGPSPRAARPVAP